MLYAIFVCAGMRDKHEVLKSKLMGKDKNIYYNKAGKSDARKCTFYYSYPEQFLSLEERHQKIQVPNMTSQM